MTSFDVIAEKLDARGDDIARVQDALRAQEVETPSWAFGNSGTRFAVFAQPGAPRDPFEKLEDAAEVQRLTGIARSVALHLPWDRVDNVNELRERAEELGLRLGAINPNLFQEPEYKLGSLCNPDVGVRRRAVAHVRECIEIAARIGSDAISLWLADGTNYPGQDSLRGRRVRLAETLHEIYDALGDELELLVEYKLYEPAFYATDLADWGSALLICQELGERAKVLVDLGHHAQGVNIEQIVSLLHGAGRLGGFHFNDRKYGDDDLIVGSIDPYQLFRIFFELIDVGAFDEGVRLTIDQSHNVEAKVEAMIQTVVNLQESYAKALLVDRAALERAQSDGDILGANRILVDAYNTDVRPLCAKVREELGAAADPIAAFRADGYADRVAQARQHGTAAAWR
ncbi:MAG: L-rhamnose isomerase / sugar isomerase [Gaiellaceae bacterium]|jgi:L-rhamnose isomerase/sugar isomerase|nr:L-rhamnose isomerase / sugar isomerase [Gaiellaceae bacterium]